MTTRREYGAGRRNGRMSSSLYSSGSSQDSPGQDCIIAMQESDSVCYVNLSADDAEIELCDNGNVVQPGSLFRQSAAFARSRDLSPSRDCNRNVVGSAKARVQSSFISKYRTLSVSEAKRKQSRLWSTWPGPTMFSSCVAFGENDQKKPLPHPHPSMVSSCFDFDSSKSFVLGTDARTKRVSEKSSFDKPSGKALNSVTINLMTQSCYGHLPSSELEAEVNGNKYTIPHSMVHSVDLASDASEKLNTKPITSIHLRDLALANSTTNDTNSNENGNVLHQDSSSRSRSLSPDSSQCLDSMVYSQYGFPDLDVAIDGCLEELRAALEQEREEEGERGCLRLTPKELSYLSAAELKWHSSRLQEDIDELSGRLVEELEQRQELRDELDLRRVGLEQVVPQEM